MLRAVLHHMDGQPALWTGVAPIADEVEAVRNGLDAIEAAAEKQATNDPEGFTEEKTAARHRAAALLASLGNRAAPYARKVGDADLRRAVDHSETEWKRMAEADFFAEAAGTLDRLTRDLDRFAGYQIDRAAIDAARDAVEAARPLAARRDAARAHRTAATAALDDGYAPLVPSLDALDDLVPELISDAEFVAGYRTARRVTDD